MLGCLPRELAFAVGLITAINIQPLVNRPQHYQLVRHQEIRRAELTNSCKYRHTCMYLHDDHILWTLPVSVINSNDHKLACTQAPKHMF